MSDAKFLTAMGRDRALRPSTIEVGVVTQTVQRCPLVEGWADQLAYLEIIFKRIRQIFIWSFE